MADRAPGPTVAELRAIGEGLVKYWPGARKTLRIYTEGLSPWSMAHRDVKIVLRDLIDSPRDSAAVKVPLHFRNRAMEFGAKYGTDIRATAAEPLTVRRDLRLGETEDAAIAAAAKKMGVPVTFFIRAAAMKAVEQLKAAERAMEGTE